MVGVIDEDRVFIDKNGGGVFKRNPIGADDCQCPCQDPIRSGGRLPYLHCSYDVGPVPLGSGQSDVWLLSRLMRRRHAEPNASIDRRGPRRAMGA